MTREEKTKLYLESFREAKKEANDALTARDEAAQRLDRANAACFAWKTIAEQAGIDLENQSQESDPPPVTSTMPPATGYIPTRQRRAQSHQPSNGSESKAEFVRRMIERAGTNGTTPAEIKEAAERAGITGYAGYPYTVIYKFKEQKKIATNAAGRLVLLPT